MGAYCETSVIYHYLWGPLPVKRKSELPCQPGVYIVMAGEDPLYVGQSRNLRRRWQEHHRKSQIPEDAELYWISTPYGEMDYLERLLIERLEPSLNGTPTPIARLVLFLEREVLEALQESADKAGTTLSSYVRELLTKTTK